MKTLTRIVYIILRIILSILHRITYRKTTAIMSLEDKYYITQETLDQFLIPYRMKGSDGVLFRRHKRHSFIGNNDISIGTLLSEVECSFKYQVDENNVLTNPTIDMVGTPMSVGCENSLSFNSNIAVISSTKGENRVLGHSHPGNLPGSIGFSPLDLSNFKDTQVIRSALYTSGKLFIGNGHNEFIEVSIITDEQKDRGDARLYLKRKQRNRINVDKKIDELDKLLANLSSESTPNEINKISRLVYRIIRIMD